MGDILRIATRGSLLAMRQSEMVAQAIRSGSGVAVELVAIVTTGDRQAGSLADAGGKGLFTAELEEALRAGRVDVAVHSAKDMPAVLGEEFAILAVPSRADPRDAVVSRHGPLESLPPGARVGTGSPRRAAQLLAARRDLRIEPVRGNVDTRVRKALGDGAELDAVVLAMAGLDRSGLREQFGPCIHPLPLEQCIPAPGQGVLAIESLAAAGKAAKLAALLEDADSRQALQAEREVVRRLQADCRSCLAVHVAPGDDGWHGLTLAADKAGKRRLRVEWWGDSAAEVGEELARHLLERNADRLLRQ
jgi:hydroxymethylbilane synthase